MLLTILKAIGWGVMGVIVTPVAVGFLTLVLSYAADSRCGSPGDSGGCEMGAFAVGAAAALPGFAIAFFVSLIRDLRRRRAPGA